MHKLMWVLLLGLFMFSFAYAEVQSFPTQKVRTDIQLKQVGADFSHCNITSIDYPNSSTFINEVPMVKNGNEYTYLVKAGNITVTGDYTTNGFCTNGTDDVVWAYPVPVTPTGGELSTGRAIAYTISFIIGIIIFIGLLLIGLYLPSGNNREEMTGYILAVNNLKYLKMVFLGFAYLTALVISYFAYILSYSYLEFDFLTNIFRFVFYTETILVFPLLVLLTYLTIANLVRDTKVKDLLSRGLRTK